MYRRRFMIKKNNFQCICATMQSVVILSVLFVNITLVFASQSGIYLDNGVDQTIMHRVLDDHEKMDVEDEILDFLGLSERPRRRHNHLSLRKSAPQYLLDVYHRLNEEENGESTRKKRDVADDNFITDLDKTAIDQSDIIMTFLNKNHHVPEVRHEHGRRLWFDVSQVPSHNYLMMAELRIYKKTNQGRMAAGNAGKEFTIAVYAIVQADDESELEILSSLNTTTDYQGWLELNVTEGLAKWLANPQDNKGIYIGVHEANRADREVRLDDIGLVHQRGADEFQPFLIGFFRGPEVIKTTPRHTRRKRNVGQSRRSRKSEMHPLLEQHHSGESMKSCQMQTLYIDFKDLEWHDWIIAPEGYGAYYCSGECNFPLTAHMNATNHAIVQTLVHLLEPKKVPKPCCAPSMLGALRVLYHINDANVNLKKYKNMIVKSCGCH
ncbi:protein 60A-like [Eupeodes corollae]|uniref:protein 60A-like n=1 Tax=Eupeodes corollae TaxID=290404 RepID=UPI00249043F0|nr:protein 60A-like [Eupeodes corollae]